MNEVRLRGVLKNISPSHTIQGVEFCKADIVTARDDGKEDVLSVRFKKYSNPYEENQIVSLKGNVRSYSTKISQDRNKVELYVFTYFDIPDLNENEQEDTNAVCLDGRICKIDSLRKTATGKYNIHFIIANNLIVSEGKKKLNSYIPCIAWGKTAESIDGLSVGTLIQIKGQLHSREYKKVQGDSFEIRVAHECVVNSVEIKDEI